MLQEVERAVARTTALVADVSELGKLNSGSAAVAKQDVDLAALLREVANGMQNPDERGMRLELQGADDPVIVAGDRPRLVRAFDALIRSVLIERANPGTIVVDLSVDSASNPGWAVVAIGDADVLSGLKAGARGPTPPFLVEWKHGRGMDRPIARRVIELLGGAVWSAAFTPDPNAGPFRSPPAPVALRLPLRT
jgi:hypothetical protein